jgi:hypothetical protein
MATKTKTKSTAAAPKKAALKDLRATKGGANKVQGGAASYGPETLTSRRQAS